jgi:hypothetical protein
MARVWGGGHDNTVYVHTVEEIQKAFADVRISAAKEEEKYEFWQPRIHVSQ